MILSKRKVSKAPKPRPANIPILGTKPASVVTQYLIVLPVLPCAETPNFERISLSHLTISESLTLSISLIHSRNILSSWLSRTSKSFCMFTF